MRRTTALAQQFWTPEPSVPPAGARASSDATAAFVERRHPRRALDPLSQELFWKLQETFASNEFPVDHTPITRE